MTKIEVAIDKVDQELYNKLTHHLFDSSLWHHLLEENLDEYKFFDEGEILVFDVDTNETSISNIDYSGRWEDYKIGVFELTEQQLKQYLIEELITDIQFHDFLVSLYLNEELGEFK